MAPTWSPSVVSVVGPVGLFLVLLARGCLAEGKRLGWSGWTWLFVFSGGFVCRSLAHGFLVWSRQNFHAQGSGLVPSFGKGCRPQR